MKQVALGDNLGVAPAQPVVAVEDTPRRMYRAPSSSNRRMSRPWLLRRLTRPMFLIQIF